MSHAFTPTDCKQRWKKTSDHPAALDGFVTNHDHLVLPVKGY